MKDINNVCFLIGARLNSQRVPKKMIRPFGDSCLFEIALKTLLNSNFIPTQYIYLSLYDQELKDIANKYDVNIFERSY